jgi:hypothetical protein
MSAYETFAIWGAGNLGSRIAFKLLELRPNTLKEVIILTRLVGHHKTIVNIKGLDLKTIVK